MTVHMVRVLCEPPKGEAESAIQNWVDNYNEWTADAVTHSLTETTVGIDGSGTAYVSGDWRFNDQGEDRTDILEDLSRRLQSFQGGLWHRLGYHVCYHDEESVGEEWTASVDNAVSLDRSPVSEVRVYDSDVEYSRGDDYTVDAETGTVTALPGGDLTDGETYFVSYAVSGLCSWDQKVEWGTVPSDLPDFEVN